MPTVQELYELWAGDAELRDALARSLEPRGTDWLFEVFAGLGPKRGDVVLDAGARDAVHSVRLVQEHGVRAVALDPLPLHGELARAAVDAAGLTDAIEIVEGAIEAMPLADASVDWIWCRDVLVHVDVDRGLTECARVLKPGGSMVAYVTLATDRLEPEESARLMGASALTDSGFHAESLEAAAQDAGLTPRTVEPLGSEWRERMLEDADWDANADLLALARLHRDRNAFVDRYGAAAVYAAEGGLLWGVYQLLGKLCPTVYVWEKRG
jgi:SAM-dependent methyltransferase